VNANDILRDLIARYPTARIVTDVGASLFSGWGELLFAKYHEAENAIELEFS
jgi:hypothetical protein